MRLSLTLLLLTPLAASAQTSLALGSHWGALTFPSFQRGWQAGVSFLSFTEHDSEGRRYGVTGPDSLAGEGPYPETVGFNILSLAYTNHLNPEATELANMMYRYGASFGVNGDLLTEHYQNEIIHRAYRDFPRVPRRGVRCDRSDFGPHCLDYSVNGEILYRFTNLELDDRLRFSASNFYSGAGMALSSVAWEGYMQFGLADFPTLVTTRWFGLRVASAARLGGMVGNPVHDNLGEAVFPELARGYYLLQGGLQTRWGGAVYPVVLGSFLSYHSGFWVDDRDRPIETLFWTLTIDIDQLYFEAFNDMLGGTDFGPTFGVRAYWDFEGRSAVFRALESFVKGLNRP